MGQPGPIVFVAGARPNFVKIAPILRALVARGGPAGLLVHTGQHYDFQMSGVFFEQLGIPAPDVHLEIGSASHGTQTGRIMAAFEDYVQALAAPPRGVIVVGDVNSTMAAALVAVKLGLPVAHVEAGLRSFDRTMPEEINRLVTDAVASLLLVSEPAGLVNLEREGIPTSRVRYVGNVMIDSLVEQLPAARALEMPARFGLRAGDYAVVTLHRPSNVDSADRLGALCDFLRRLAGEIAVVFPVHPRTDHRLTELRLRASLDTQPRLQLAAPLGYREFLGLMDGARLVVTDSGGVQEETTYLGIPCVTMRSSTERPVTVTAGSNTLVGDDLGAAWDAAVGAMSDKYSKQEAIPGWDGLAATRVIDAILEAWR